MKKLLATAVLMLSVSMFCFSIEICCDEWEPYQYTADGKGEGFSFEVVQAVMAKMSVKPVNITFFPWERALKMVKDGEKDALFSSTFSEDRTGYAVYPTESLIDYSWVCWTRKDSGITIAKLEDLKGKKIGVVSGYNYGQVFMDYIKANCTVEAISDDLTNFQKVNGKRVDVIVADFLNGSYFIKKNPALIGVSSQPYIIKKDSLFILFNKTKNKKEFVDQFSKTLADYKKTAEYKTIFDKYFK